MPSWKQRTRRITAVGVVTMAIAWSCGVGGETGAPLLAGDWATWRGPYRNGIADPQHPAPPTTWSDAQHVVWKVAIPGRGHSSPTILGDKIFLTTADEKSATQAVLALDRRTGRQLWLTPISQGGLPEIHPKNTHATPTVAADRQRLYAAFHHHGAIELAALTHDGTIAWQRKVGDYEPRKFRYGYAASPMLHGSLVLLAADYDGGGWLVGLDAATGQDRWRTARDPKQSYSSPVVAHIGGREQLLISGLDVVASYDPLSGRSLWATPATTMATCGTVVWDGDFLFASGGFPDSQTACLRGDTGQVVWQNEQQCYEQSMLAVGGHLYAVNERGIAYCWRARDGREMWSSRLPGGPVSSSPILANGLIYQLNEQGAAYVFQAQPDHFELVARNQLGEEAFATPAFCDGRIYLRTATTVRAARQEWLYCLGTP